MSTALRTAATIGGAFGLLAAGAVPALAATTPPSAYASLLSTCAPSLSTSVDLSTPDAGFGLDDGSYTTQFFGGTRGPVVGLLFASPDTEDATSLSADTNGDLLYDVSASTGEDGKVTCVVLAPEAGAIPTSEGGFYNAQAGTGDPVAPPTTGAPTDPVPVPDPVTPPAVDPLPDPQPTQDTDKPAPTGGAPVAPATPVSPGDSTTKGVSAVVQDDVTPLQACTTFARAAGVAATPEAVQRLVDDANGVDPKTRTTVLSVKDAKGVSLLDSDGDGRYCEELSASPAANAVPAAKTDGADLVATGGAGGVAAGVTLLGALGAVVGAGVLRARRLHTQG